jgi:hypothetical protein
MNEEAAHRRKIHKALLERVTIVAHNKERTLMWRQWSQNQQTERVGLRLRKAEMEEVGGVSDLDQKTRTSWFPTFLRYWGWSVVNGIACRHLSYNSGQHNRIHYNLWLSWQDILAYRRRIGRRCLHKKMVWSNPLCLQPRREPINNQASMVSEEPRRISHINKMYQRCEYTLDWRCVTIMPCFNGCGGVHFKKKGRPLGCLH